MKKVVKMSLALLGFVAMVSVSAINAGDEGTKVLVNHTCANGTKTIELAIDQSALEGHLSHGDTVVDDGSGGGM